MSAIAAAAAAPRRARSNEYEAATFLHDTAFDLASVKLLPGEFYVHDRDDLLLTTVLGSCVAACLVDRSAGIGGMNHFMLPDGGSAGRYGAFAMELLINEMMKRGARRERLEAKIFGGGHVLGHLSALNIGERNVRFVERFLADERIAIVSRDVLDVWPRRVCLFAASGRALVKKLGAGQRDAVAHVESRYERMLSSRPARGGEVELF